MTYPFSIGTGLSSTMPLTLRQFLLINLSSWSRTGDDYFCITSVPMVRNAEMIWRWLTSQRAFRELQVSWAAEHGVGPCGLVAQLASFPQAAKRRLRNRHHNFDLTVPERRRTSSVRSSPCRSNCPSRALPPPGSPCLLQQPEPGWRPRKARRSAPPAAQVTDEVPVLATVTGQVGPGIGRVSPGPTPDGDRGSGQDGHERPSAIDP
jgi:hypothetical protein